MGIDIFILIAGLAMIIVGANLLTDGSVVIARRFNISELVIGLTIIAVGTSTPELVVSVVSSIKGSTEMAVGNVIGSNMFNSLMILGISALISPLRLTKENTYRNIPLSIATTFILVIFLSSIFGLSFMPTEITRWEGCLLLIGFISFIIYTVSVAKRRSVRSSTFGQDVSKEVGEIIPKKKGKSLFISILMIIGGLGGLIVGGDIFLDKAVKIAQLLGVSEFIISVTLMAGGTSLPELASCVVAARRGRSQMALGNVIGSNVSNILLVLGSAAIINPLSISAISILDVIMLAVSSLLLVITPFSFKKGRVDRIEGVILIAIYIFYIFMLIF